MKNNMILSYPTNLILFIFLAILCIISIAIGTKCLIGKKYVKYCIYKGFASLMFVLCGLISVINYPDHSNEVYLNLIILVFFGLICGFFGDILLALKNFFKKNSKEQILFIFFGMLIFIMGHIFYLIVLLKQCFNWLAFILAFLLSIFVVFITWRKFKISIVYYILEFVYAFILSSLLFLSIATLLTSFQAGNSGLLSFPIVCIFCSGILIFVIADIITARGIISNIANKNTTIKKFSDCPDLLFYYIAQLLIALSICLL